MTDRFSKGNGDTSPCGDLGKYCGGTFKGIEQNLDYIQGAGFNAIWISPVQTNTPNSYHGYAPLDFYGINPNFGTEQDLKDLIKACHEKDIWVMVDIVANHVALGQEKNNYTDVSPFNDRSHYHEFLLECHDVEKLFPDNDTALESCWLHNLPDLNQDNPFVRKALLEWIAWLVKTYEFDGLRLDALRHVSKGFWREFSDAAGVFTLGEVWDERIEYGARYQKYVDSILNFPLAEKLNGVFRNEQPMNGLTKYYKDTYAAWPDVTTLANFVDCHDKARFLSYSGDIASFKASLAFTICSIGIPAIYYGSEQAFNGGDDPQNREPLWTSMNTDSEMYDFLRTLNEFRKNTKFYEHDQIERYADDTFYAFSRGEYLFAFTNSMETQERTITFHPYEEGTWLCNAFNNKDCVQVVDGEFKVSISNKDTKILYPKKEEDNQEPEISASKIWKNIKNFISNSIVQDISM